MAATKAAHTRANNVLKYLRWRNTDASGQSPDGYRGEIFDLDPQAKLLGVREWQPEAKGQAGQFTDSTFDWSWRSWLAAFKEEDRAWVLGDGDIVEVGCGPIMGTEDPCEGMKGPVWDLWFRPACPALAGASAAQERVVYVHPSASGSIKRSTEALEADRWAAWQGVRYHGMSAQLRALYPDIGPKKYPRGRQVQIGGEEAGEALFGGKGSGGTSGLALWSRGQSGAAAASSAAALAASSALPPPPARPPPRPKPLPAVLPLPPAPQGKASASSGPQTVYMEYEDATQTRARWGGLELQWHNWAWYSHWQGQWWVLKGPSPEGNHYNPSLHWWEAM